MTTLRLTTVGDPARHIGMGRSLRHPLGFTIIELLVTLIVAGVMLTIAIPNFVWFIRENRLGSQANDFVASINYARSEAIKRTSGITVCPKNASGSACVATTAWENGWIVFVDANADGAIDAGDTILRQRDAIEGGNTLRSATRTRITFRSTGYSLGFNDTLNLCDSDGTASGRTLTLSGLGRISVASPASTCP